MRIACGITTALRRVSYLKETIASVEAAGFELALVAEDRELAGPYRNFKRTVRMLLGDPYAEAVAVFQDDVQVAANLKGWLDRNGWPDDPERIGVVSLYTAFPHHRNRTGWHRLPLQVGDSSDSDP